MRKSRLTTVHEARTATVKRAPADVPKELRSTYREIVEHLQESGKFHPTDERMVRLYLHALHEAEEMRLQIADEGRVVATSTGGVKSHPLLSALNNTRQTAAKIAGTLGLSPAARVKISTSVETGSRTTHPADPWADDEPPRPKRTDAAKHLDA